MQVFKKEYIIGLDIGSSSVKLAQFIKKEGGLRLVKADLKKIKYTNDDTIRDKEIVYALRSLFKGIDVKKSKIIVSMNCSMTSTKKIVTPYMPKGELRKALDLEARSCFPFSTDKTILDFEILGDVVERGIRKYEVSMAACPRITVDKYLTLLKKVGITPDSLVPSSYALQKLVEYSSFKENKTRCFVDIGERYTELLVFKAKDLLFSRKIPVAGNDFTKDMTGALVSDRGKTELSLEEAEEIKLKIGIPPEGESKIIDDKISTTQIRSMLRAPLEQLVNEIDRCFDYYSEESDGGRIDSLVLFGGGAALKGLTKFLSEGLGIEVMLGDALEGLYIEGPRAIVEKAKISYRLELAIGAALSAKKGINVLPPEIKEVTKMTFKRTTFEVMVVAAILILAFIYIGMRIRLTNFQKRKAAARMELLSLRPQLKQVEMQNLASKILRDEPYWEDVFKELSNIVPGNIYFTEFAMKGKTIRMQGVVASKEPEKFLSDLILALENGIFKNVKLVSTRKSKGRFGNEFELKCWVD